MFDPKFSVSLRIECADDEEMPRALRQAGIGCVDADLCSAWKQPYEEQEAELSRFERRMRVLSGQFEINAVHVSFGRLWSLCETDEKARAFAVRRTLDVCRRAEPFGARYAVVHTNGVDFPADGDRGAAISALRRSLAETAEGTALTIAVENLPRTCLGNSLAEMRQILDGLPVKAVFDVNHVFSDPIPDFVRGLAGKLVTLHVSDNDGADERHWLPGEGVIDWFAFLKALEDVGYSGAFNYEVSLNARTDGRPGYTPAEAADNFRRLIDGYNASAARARSPRPPV